MFNHVALSAHTKPLNLSKAYGGHKALCKFTEICFESPCVSSVEHDGAGVMTNILQASVPEGNYPVTNAY